MSTTTLERVLAVVADHALPGRTPAPDSRLEDLGLDSLDRWEMIPELEDAFGHPIDDAAYVRCNTVADLVALVERQP